MDGFNFSESIATLNVSKIMINYQMKLVTCLFIMWAECQYLKLKVSDM